MRVKELGLTQGPWTNSKVGLILKMRLSDLEPQKVFFCQSKGSSKDISSTQIRF